MNYQISTEDSLKVDNKMKTHSFCLTRGLSGPKNITLELCKKAVYEALKTNN